MKNTFNFNQARCLISGLSGHHPSYFVQLKSVEALTKYSCGCTTYMRETEGESDGNQKQNADPVGSKPTLRF